MLKPSMRAPSLPAALVASAVLAVGAQDIAPSDKARATTDASVGLHAKNPAKPGTVLAVSLAF